MLTVLLKDGLYSLFMQACHQRTLRGTVLLAALLCICQGQPFLLLLLLLGLLLLVVLLLQLLLLR